MKWECKMLRTVPASVHLEMTMVMVTVMDMIMMVMDTNDDDNGGDMMVTVNDGNDEGDGDHGDDDNDQWWNWDLRFGKIQLKLLKSFTYFIVFFPFDPVISLIRIQRNRQENLNRTFSCIWKNSKLNT